MAIDTSSPRSRRALLSAAVGGIAALAAGAVVPHRTAEAANGDPLVLGSASNAASATTKLSNTGGVVDVLTVATTGGVAVRGDSTHGFGVYGASTNGYGVGGNATDGIGIVGTADTGTAVQGYAPRGTGVLAKSEMGIALSVAGKVHFSRSGRTWIRAGHSSLTVTQVGTAPNSRVFATLASNRPGRYVRAVVPSTNSFTVYLNANALSDSVVAWFVLD